MHTHALSLNDFHVDFPFSRPTIQYETRAVHEMEPAGVHSATHRRTHIRKIVYSIHLLCEFSLLNTSLWWP